MGEHAERLLNDALGLPPAERATLAAALLASLDGEPEEKGVDEAWAKEIERRARRLLSGEDPGEPWDKVRADLWREFVEK